MDKNIDECCICFEKILSIETKELPCKHNFHNDCISQWFKKHISCPICRKTILHIHDLFPQYIKNIFKNFDKFTILPWKNEYLGFTGYIDRIPTNNVTDTICIGIDKFKRPFLCFRGKITENDDTFSLEESKYASVLFQRYNNNPYTYVFANKAGDLLFDIKRDIKIIQNLSL